MNVLETTAVAGTLPKFSVVIVGHVDHGKSTLVGRLVHDTGGLQDGKLEALQHMSAKRGMPFEWAFLLDAFQAERDQGVTIDTSQIRFRSAKRDYLVIDAPGHREFLKNMVTGAAAAEGAVLVVDAVDGVREQTRQHGYLLRLLGIRRVLAVVNKMDLAGFSEPRFKFLRHEVVNYLAELGFARDSVEVVPVVARDGDNIASRSTRMNWYQGPTLLDALDSLEKVAEPTEESLRFLVQDVYKFDERRIVAGRVESGTVAAGGKILFSPSGKVARVKSIEAWNVAPAKAFASAGESIGITLDSEIFVERGQIGSHETDRPMLTNIFRANLFWLGKNPLVEGARYRMRLGAAEYVVQVDRLEHVIDVNSLASSNGKLLERNGVGVAVFRSRGLIALDPFKNNNHTGRFVLIDDFSIVGGGLVDMAGFADQASAHFVRSNNIQQVDHRVSLRQRWEMNAHRSGILWFTGLPSAGKSTLAVLLERELTRRGMHAFVLDGDNIRHGLAADLGFSKEDRTENIRRVGEVSKLFAEAGTIVITSFISPYRNDRDWVRASANGSFHEIHIRAPVEVCEARDPKGHYKKARNGQIVDFTGVSAPYEAPLAPELTVDTALHSVDECIGALLDYVVREFGL
jgi:bifunctional enzyme CysN/CysC